MAQRSHGIAHTKLRDGVTAERAKRNRKPSIPLRQRVIVTSSNEGTVKDGKVILEAKANSRLSIEIGLAEEFSGAVKVVAHEV